MSTYCEACGCDPCDCDWGNCAQHELKCERCGMEYKYCECHWGDRIKGGNNAKNMAHKRYTRSSQAAKSS